MADTDKARDESRLSVAREDGEPFLARWSRLKTEARERPTANEPAASAAEPNASAPQLPPLDKLTFESDYRVFFHSKVGEEMRRAALKKLFHDPHFNVMDGLDVYIDDYSKSDPIPAAMLAQLNQAQKILEHARERKMAQGAEEEGRRQETVQAPSVESRESAPPADVSAVGMNSGEPPPANPQRSQDV